MVFPGFLWFFIFVVTIPVIVGVGGDIARRWIRLKERQLKLMSSEVAEKAARYAAQTERLEQRVRVLERIATDRGVDLAGEIESLRNQELN